LLQMAHFRMNLRMELRQAGKKNGRDFL